MVDGKIIRLPLCSVYRAIFPPYRQGSCQTAKDDAGPTRSRYDEQLQTADQRHGNGSGQERQQSGAEDAHGMKTVCVEGGALGRGENHIDNVFVH